MLVLQNKYCSTGHNAQIMSQETQLILKVSLGGLAICFLYSNE